MATTVVEGELYESITGQLFEIGRQLRQKGGYPFNPEELKRALQAAIEGKFPKVGFELYFSPEQKRGKLQDGFEFEEHLKSKKLLDRTMSVHHELVKSWIADPTTYPEEFKGKTVCLWKSQRGSGSHRGVAGLTWHAGRVVDQCFLLCGGWFDNYPVLLESS